MSIVTLNALLKTAARKLTHEPVFWVLTGTLLYFSGTFAVMGLSNELMKLGRWYFDFAWHINWGLTIIANMLYAKGVLCKAQV